MTKKELLEAIKDMPEDAEVFAYDSVNAWHWGTLDVKVQNTSYGKEIIIELGY